MIGRHRVNLDYQRKMRKTMIASGGLIKFL